MPPKYRLTTLGWYNFEILVQTLLKQIIGPGVSSIGGTKDQGRDAHFRGSAAFPSGETSWSGEWIFQIKYVETDDSREAQQRLRNSFKNEAHTILQRRRKGKINNYILLTNAPASAKLRGELETATNHFADRFGLIDGKEICQFLDLHPPIRRAYPQLLGLADLDLIVNRRTYERSKAYMQEWQPKLCTFVKTTVFEKALNTLEQRHFIVLDGPPEAGKSTIAAALAVLKAAESFQVVQLLGADEFFNVYDENSLQLFIADDAVGSIKFDPSLSDGWSRNLGAILSTLNAKHLLVWTTRKYVLEEALAETRLGEAVKDFPRVQEVLVEVDKFSTLEKASMLYNHAKHARLTPESKDLIRNCAREIAAHRDFTPERVRQCLGGRGNLWIV